MGAVQAQILRPGQGTRMALTQALTQATSTSSKSRLGATLLSLLLLPISQALPTTEGQNWLARSTCVLDALAHGGVVDSEKFNQCMDCWRRSSDESLQTATACLTSLPQFCKRHGRGRRGWPSSLCGAGRRGAELSPPAPLPHKPHWWRHLLWLRILSWIWSWIGRIGNSC